MLKNGDPYGIRTRVTAVKGRCLNHLTKGPFVQFSLSRTGQDLYYQLFLIYATLFQKKIKKIFQVVYFKLFYLFKCKNFFGILKNMQKGYLISLSPGYKQPSYKLRDYHTIR